jgi:hypothetical protein
VANHSSLFFYLKKEGEIMQAGELLVLGRGLLDDTQAAKYLWSTDELVACLNRSINDVCKKVKLLKDSSSSFCSIYMLAGVSTYDTSELILSINSMILSAATVPLGRTSERWMHQNVVNWKNVTGTPISYIPEYEYLKFRVYPYYDSTYVVEGDSNITFTAATKKISRPTGGLSIFEEGDLFNVSDTTENDGDFTVDTVSDTEIVVLEALVNEVNTSAVLRRVEETATLSVIRLPLTPITSAGLTVEPPIPEDDHMSLLDGILGYAYLKQDTETYDPQKAARHLLMFQGSINDMKKKYKDKTGHAYSAGPHPGTI